MTLQGYYNRFDADKRFDAHLIRAGKGVQSAEINEIQSCFSDRLQRIADAVFRDGAVISGALPIINQTTGSTICPASRIYIRGAMRSVPERTITIPLTGLVRIGVFLLDEEITEVEDATLRDPAINTRNYNEPGAGRLRVTPTWGREGDGSLGAFYPVYTVIDGVLQNQQPSDNSFMEALARYDRESNGNYVVTGLTVQALGLNAGANTLSVKEGTGNIFGYKIDRPAATRLVYTEDPDLELVEAEPDTFTAATGGTSTIQLNHFPLSSIIEVVIVRQKTVSITRGGFSGGQDTLPDVSVLSINSITQGGTTYQSPRDYFLNGDKVDWSPTGAGAIEPSPGSTYSITYQYLGNVTPSAINYQAGTFQVTGAVNGSLVLTDYEWKLPRYDRVCIDRAGNFSRVKGLSSRFTVLPPVVPANLLSLATIGWNWGATPTVINDAIRAIPFDQLESMRRSILDLYDLVALERLKNDISSREPSSKRGVFVDPFIDDDLRDQGLTQTGAIVDGALQLPIVATAYRAATNNTQDWMLPYTEEIILEQGQATGSSPINPYQSFDPIPAAVTLSPAVDRFTLFDTIWSSPATQQVMTWLGTTGRFSIQSITSTTRTELLSETERPAEFLRQIDISFTVEGFDPGETLTQVLFDGINVTPA
jgi:hypothetical protein